jgi:hypothetical protein
MGSASRTVLFQFDTSLIVPTVFFRGVGSFFAFIARQGNHLPSVTSFGHEPSLSVPV